MQVDFRKVGKDYGATPAVRDVDLTVPAGAFVALIGPSGCGKSTVLRMVAGLEHIDFGEIQIDGRRINDVAPKDRDVAMVFQNYALYPHMTVRENLGFSLRMTRCPKEEARRRIAEAASILEIEPFLDRYPRHLSGGQRQRVAMGRAIVRNPRVFLFDEPLSNLDAQLRVQMRAEIKRLHRALGVTVIFVTHDQVEALTMADIVVVLRAGRVEQVGAPLELYDDPANAFVATFIGAPAMTLVAGRIRCEEGPRLVSDEGAVVSLGPGLAERIGEVDTGREVLLGLRPEHVAFATPDGTRPEAHEIAGEATLVERTGLDTHVAVATRFGSITALARGRSDVETGHPVMLRPDYEQAFLFDARDGRRLA
jgi:multiple sugar transport system ATP-binding protein